MAKKIPTAAEVREYKEIQSNGPIRGPEFPGESIWRFEGIINSQKAGKCYEARCFGIDGSLFLRTGLCGGRACSCN